MTLGQVLARRARVLERQPGLCKPIPEWNYFFPFRMETGTVMLFVLGA